MKTVTREDPEYLECLDKVAEMVSNLPNDKLRDNYSYDNLKIDEWIAVSVFEGGFSSLAWRPLWGNNCRILNRFYKTPEYRFENDKRKVSQETLDMIQQQIDVGKRLDFECGFMSRDGKFASFNYYKKHLPQTWHSPKERYLMWETGYQHIMWTPLNSNNLYMIVENEIALHY